MVRAQSSGKAFAPRPRRARFAWTSAGRSLGTRACGTSSSAGAARRRGSPIPTSGRVRRLNLAGPMSAVGQFIQRSPADRGARDRARGLSLDRMTPRRRNAASSPAVAYLVLRFPLLTETFVLRELNAVADRMAFPIELFALRPGRGGTVHPMANRWLPVVQTASIARGCFELLRLPITRPRVVARVIRDVVFDYARDLRALVRGLAVVVLAASFVPAIRRRRVDSHPCALRDPTR